MSKSLDERGRIYIPKDVRERFGETYRIVELLLVSRSSPWTRTRWRALVLP